MKKNEIRRKIRCVRPRAKLYVLEYTDKRGQRRFDLETGTLKEAQKQAKKLLLKKLTDYVVIYRGVLNCLKTRK